MGACGLLHGTAFLAWQRTRGNVPRPKGRSAELGMLWIAEVGYDEHNIKGVMYAAIHLLATSSK